MRTAINFQNYLRARMGWQSEHFSPEELLWSGKAAEAGLDNLPTFGEWQMLARFTAEVLGPVRRLAGRALVITSGFRDPQVNRLVGGTDDSDHQFQIGGAADFRPQFALQQQIEDFFRTISKNAASGVVATADGKIAVPFEDTPPCPPVNGGGIRIEFDQLILYPGRIHIGWRPGDCRYEVRRMVVVVGRKTWPLMGKAEI